nr:MAG TPA: hypothetical protein [Caudoviricetes sp.]
MAKCKHSPCYRGLFKRLDDGFLNKQGQIIGR